MGAARGRENAAFRIKTPIPSRHEGNTPNECDDACPPWAGCSGACSRAHTPVTCWAGGGGDYWAATCHRWSPRSSGRRGAWSSGWRHGVLEETPRWAPSLRAARPGGGSLALRPHTADTWTPPRRVPAHALRPRCAGAHSAPCRIPGELGGNVSASWSSIHLPCGPTPSPRPGQGQRPGPTAPTSGQPGATRQAPDEPTVRSAGASQARAASEGGGRGGVLAATVPAPSPPAREGHWLGAAAPRLHGLGRC